MSACATVLRRAGPNFEAVESWLRITKRRKESGDAHDIPYDYTPLQLHHNNLDLMTKLLLVMQAPQSPPAPMNGALPP